jgi:hypothetical protein
MCGAGSDACARGLRVTPVDIHCYSKCVAISIGSPGALHRFLVVLIVVAVIVAIPLCYMAGDWIISFIRIEYVVVPLVFGGLLAMLVGFIAGIGGVAGFGVMGLIFGVILYVLCCD